MATLRDAVSGAELDRHLRAIAQVVRLSGTPEEAEAFDYIEGQLKGFGYAVERYESDALIGYPRRSSLTLLAGDPAEIVCNGYSLSPATGPRGVVGELVHVGAGMWADYGGQDVRGKVVLCDGLATPEAAMAAAEAGAAGQIFVNGERIHEMCISPVWGTPVPETAGLLPRVPAVGITWSDGDRLKALLRRGPVGVRLVTEPYRAWTKIPTLTADLPGRAEDRFVLFSGHVDSWHYGAMDNGTANAAQLEVARLLADRRGDLRRGVRLAFWSGHSHGRYAGSAWYADAFWHDLYARCVCHVNVDSVGAKGATVLTEAETMAETYGFARRLLAEAAGVELRYRRFGRTSDQSFWGIGLPSVFAALSEQPAAAEDDAVAELLGGGGLGWWWHTPEDTLDKIDSGNLVRDAGIYAEALWRLCTLERLPFDTAAAAEEISQALGRYQDAGGSDLDLTGVRALAADLGVAIRGSGLDRFEAERANEVVLALCRLLIPVNYTRSGPFDQDLAVETAPVPGLVDAGQLASLDRASDAQHFLRTKLVRQRNRLEHALRQAAAALPG